jgi:hypothetical protein
MIRPNKPAWQISVRHIGNLLFALPLSAGGALIVWKLSFWRQIGPTVGVVFFVVPSRSSRTPFSSGTGQQISGALSTVKNCDRSGKSSMTNCRDVAASSVFRGRLVKNLDL